MQAERDAARRSSAKWRSEVLEVALIEVSVGVDKGGYERLPHPSSKVSATISHQKPHVNK